VVTQQKQQAYKRELVGRYGFDWNYLKRWQAKTTYWLHADILNAQGGVAKPAGLEMPNMPGHPDQAMGFAKRGILPWEPGENCECRGCRERFGTERTGKAFMKPAEVLKQAQTADSPLTPAEADAQRVRELQEAKAGPVVEADAAPRARRVRASCDQCNWKPRKRFISEERDTGALKLHIHHKHKEPQPVAA
jgi:hypothetical protein